MRRIYFTTIVVLIIALGLIGREVQLQWRQPLVVAPNGYHLIVAAGDRFRTVVDQLHRDEIVPHPWLLLAYGRWTSLDEQIKRGEYLIPAGTKASRLLQILTLGEVIQYSVTLPEGITLRQALDLLATQQPLKKVLQGLDDERIKALVSPRDIAEGLFFPDSYHYAKGATDWQILQRAYSRMELVLAQEWANRMSSLPYETAYDALIMASIVERETGVPSERQRIAGVFVKRLLSRMRLQTDPSVIYGLGESFDGNLRRKHLKDESNSYNTYRHRGLPPSPIALPGRASIHAALNPDSGEALYFVARGDGSHEFTNTLEEHEKAVRKFQLNRVKNYRSNPETK